MEERLAHLEGVVTGQTQVLIDLRSAVSQLKWRVDRRFDQVEARFAIIEGRLNALDQKIDQKIDAVHELSANFHWLIGVQATVFVGLLAAILAR